MESSLTSTSRHIFTAEEIGFLECEFQAGLTSTGGEMLPKINEIAAKLSLSVEVIKTWIKNRNRKGRKRMAPINEAVLQGTCLTPYQVFIKLYHKDDRPENAALSLGDKSKAAAEAWKVVDGDVRDKCVSLSASSKRTSKADLTEDARLLLINKKINKMQDLVTDLNELGCAVVCVCRTHPTKTLHVARIGNSLAKDFGEELPAQLIVHLNNKNKTGGQSWTNHSVKEMFNEKWVKAGGKGGKPNYAAVGITYDVAGLPSDIPFHRWQDYGKCQVANIMSAESDINFIFKSSTPSTAGSLD